MYRPTSKTKNKEVTILYCPTKNIEAYFFTKLLQGVLYFSHRNAVLGINEEWFHERNCQSIVWDMTVGVCCDNIVIIMRSLLVTRPL